LDTYPPGTALGIFAGGKVTGGDSGREPYISFEETGLGGQDDLTKKCHLKINHEYHKMHNTASSPFS